MLPTDQPTDFTKPLFGRRIVVTRAPEQARELAAQLSDLGATVVLLPAISFPEPAAPGPLGAALQSTRSGSARFAIRHPPFICCGGWSCNCRSGGCGGISGGPYGAGVSRDCSGARNGRGFDAKKSFDSSRRFGGR